MPIIYNYKLAAPDNNDLLLGTDINDSNLTKSFKVSDLASLISGQVVKSVPQTIPVTGSDSDVTNSIITQSGDNTSVTVHGDMYVDETLYVNTFSVSSLTQGRVVFAGAEGVLNDSPNLTFDGANLYITGSLETTLDSSIGRNLNVLSATSTSSLSVTSIASIGGVLTMASNIDMGNNSMINLLDPTNPKDAATKSYVDSLFSTGGGTVSGTGTNNKLTLWSNGAGGVIADSLISQNGTTIQVAGALTSTQTTGLSTTSGVLNIGSNSNSQTFTSLNFLSGGITNTAVISNPAIGGILKFQTNTNTDRLVINNDGSILLNNYGSGNNTGTEVYSLSVDGTGKIIESPLPVPGSGNGTVTSIATGPELIGGPITTSGTISLSDTLVTPGSYTLANITVDQKGRITSASSGTAGAGTVTSVGINLGTTGVDLNIQNSPVTTSGDITLNIPSANASTRGVLTSADWTNFNSKQSALTLGDLTETGSSILTLTGNTGAIVGSGLTIQVAQASTNQNGFLSSSDFSAFESKQNEITLTTTGTSGAATFDGTTLNIPNYGTSTPSLATTNLTDVSSSLPADNQVLAFDSALGYYKPSSVPTIGAGVATEVAIFDSGNSIISDSAIAINSTSQILLDVLYNSASYADDAAATAAGVPYGGLYRTGSVLKINMASAPTPPITGQTTIGSLIWTTENHDSLISSSGTIPIFGTIQELSDAYTNPTPGAVYYDLNQANSARGLLYNQTAAAIITPPAGFRLPTASDYDNLRNELSAISGNVNDVTPGGGGAIAFWNATIKANPGYGSSGFNSIKAGSLNYISANNTIGLYPQSESWWNSDALVGVPTVKTFSEQAGFIYYQNTNGSQNGGYFSIRFCKDA